MAIFPPKASLRYLGSKGCKGMNRFLYCNRQKQSPACSTGSSILVACGDKCCETLRALTSHFLILNTDFARSLRQVVYTRILLSPWVELPSQLRDGPFDFCWGGGRGFWKKKKFTHALVKKKLTNTQAKPKKVLEFFPTIWL